VELISHRKSSNTAYFAMIKKNDVVNSSAGECTPEPGVDPVDHMLFLIQTILFLRAAGSTATLLVY